MTKKYNPQRKSEVCIDSSYRVNTAPEENGEETLYFQMNHFMENIKAEVFSYTVIKSGLHLKHALRYKCEK